VFVQENGWSARTTDDEELVSGSALPGEEETTGKVKPSQYMRHTCKVVIIEGRTRLLAQD
jgi:hypothetical protein